MKQNVKRVLSLMLSLVLVVTGLTITPTATVDVRAEMKSEITSNMDNGTAGVAYYWKGESFELTFESTTTGLDFGNGITVKKDGADASGQFSQLSVASTDSSTQTGVKIYKISATLKADATAGKYTFTVTDGTTITKDITVYDKDCFVPSPIYSNNTFYNNPSKSFTENFVYSTVAKNASGKDVEFKFTDAEGNSMDDYLSVKVSSAELNKFKGCASYDVTVTPTKNLDSNNKPTVSENGLALQLHVTYTDHNNQEQEDVYEYTMLQSATAISNLALLDCSKTNVADYYGMEKADFLSQYPHNKDGSIYIDATETVYFMFQVDNGYDDEFEDISFNVTNSVWEGIFDYSEDKAADEYGFITKSGAAYMKIGDNTYYILKLTAKEGATTANRSTPLQMTLSTKSGALSAIYNIYVYNTYESTNRVPKMQVREIYKNGTIGSWTDASTTKMRYNPYNQYGRYQFQVINIDVAENLIFHTDSINNAIFVSGETTSSNAYNDLKYPQKTPATLSIKGTGSIGELVAYTAETLTRPAKAYTISSGTQNIDELVLPEADTFKIQKENKDIISDSVSVGTEFSYSLYSWGKKEAGVGADATSNYSDYIWESSDPSVATVDNTGKVKTLKQGTTRIVVRTNYGDNYGREDIETKPVTLNVYSPISTLGVLTIEGETCKESIVAGREYTFKADKKDANGEESTQEVEWQIADTTYAAILDAEGNEASSSQWVTGDTCKLKVRDLTTTEAATIKLTCRASGISNVSSIVTMTVKPEIQAQSLYIDYDQETSLRNIVGSTTTLKAKQFADAAQETASNEELVWSSTNPDVVSVEASEDGSSAKLSFLSTGDAVITVKTANGALSDSVNVATIKKATTVTVSCSDKSNVVSSSNAVTLTATLSAGATDPVEWSVTPENAVTFEEVSNGVVKVVANKDYDAGTKVTITATATDAAISKNLTLTIKKSVDDFVVTGMQPEYEYTGSAITPHKLDGFQITCDGTVLTENTDYSVSIAGGTNTNVGSSKLVITGKNNYTGVKEIEFKIVPKSITIGTVKINNGNNYTYTGSAITLEPARGVAVTVPVGTTTKTLTSNDYDVVCTNNVNAGTASVTITGKGNYTGTIQTTFQIDAKDISKITAQITPTTFEYTGNAVCPAATVKDGTKELVAGTDYVVTYTNNVEVSSSALKPTATITGKGNYTGTKSITFNITAQELKVENITLSKTDYTYNGKNRKPKVTVRNSNGVKLQADKDYTITYPNDVTNIGIKSITITGKGNYKGNVKAEYGIAEKVTVKKASIKKVKNSKTKKVTIEVKPVSGADGYEISYSTSKKFTKDTTKVVTSKKAKKTIKKLQKGKTYYFKVRAYKVNSIGRTIYGKASAVKKVKIKK